MRRTVRPGGDAGVGLVELLVGMVVGSLVLTVLAAVYMTSLRTTAVVTAKASTTQDVALAADVIARRLRVAVPLTEAQPAVVVMEPRRVSIYASLAAASAPAVDPVPTLVTYQYDGPSRCLVESLVQGTGSAPPYSYTSAPRTTCLLRGDINGGAAMFKYYATAEGGSPTTSAADVRAVDVVLAVTQQSGPGSAATRAGARAVLENVR